MKNNKGFTLIELLVVIAIIGILSSVVLASLTTARSRGQAASVQSSLSNMRAQAELYYSTNTNSYGTASDCTTGLFGTASNGLGNLVAGAASAAGQSVSTFLTCSASSTSWSVKTNTAVGGQFFCVDGAGKSLSSSSTITVTNNVCQ
jgi:type IV pilus assembly protein PilA